MFDPHVHEAMFETPNEDVPNGTVIHVLRDHKYKQQQQQQQQQLEVTNMVLYGR